MSLLSSPSVCPVELMRAKSETRFIQHELILLSAHPLSHNPTPFTQQPHTAGQPSPFPSLGATFLFLALCYLSCTTPLLFIIMNNPGYTLWHDTATDLLDLDVNVVDESEALALGKRLGKNKTFQRLNIKMNDLRNDRHCNFLIWLFCGISRNRMIREVIFTGVDFCTDRTFFSIALKKWLLCNDRLQKISFSNCSFHGISQIVVLGQSLSSPHIRDVCFRCIDFTSISRRRSLAMAYISQIFHGKSINFIQCFLLPSQLRELIRGLSEGNHPSILSLEGNRSQLNRSACRLLNKELTNHTGIPTLNPPISVLSLRGCVCGDNGVSALLARGLEPIALVHLNLCRCNITDKGCAVIASMLRDLRAPLLKKLVLSQNRINDQGAILIAEALSANSVLRNLSISNSYGRISEHSWLAFQQVLFNDQSSLAITTSNHALTSLALKCGREPNISKATQVFLDDLLSLNNVGCTTRDGVNVVTREKLILWAHNLLIDHGAFGVMCTFFPGFTTRHDRIVLISLFLEWTSGIYRRAYNADLLDSVEIFRSNYWMNRPKTTRELSLFYRLVQLMMSSEI